VDILGLPVRQLDAQGLVDLIIARTSAGLRSFACYANAHTMNLAMDDARYFNVLRDCGLLYADGASVVWASRFSTARLPHRITAADHFPRLASAAAAEGLSIYLLGGQPGIARDASRALERENPTLRIAGFRDGHFDLADSPRIVDQINAAKPDILAVGMSSPRQEFWVEENARKLDAKALWCVGALFDYLAGHESRAPAWLCSAGFEWLWRLGADPAGKWRRYLLGNPRFVWNVLRHKRATSHPHISAAKG
jgi:N-acetylglucosaminyldiphosphoundecaprenol N-acetyl-beta-D-mannosaminyltransferase